MLVPCFAVYACECVSVRFHRHTFSNEGPYSKDCLIRCALMKCVMQSLLIRLFINDLHMQAV